MEKNYIVNDQTRYILREELVQLEETVWWASCLTNPDIIVTNTNNFEDVDAYRSAALQELARINVRRQELLKILLE